MEGVHSRMNQTCTAGDFTGTASCLGYGIFYQLIDFVN